MLKLTSSLAARKGISKILIDGCRVSGNLSAAQRVELGATLADHVSKLGATPRIAFVGHPPTFNGLAAVTSRGRGVTRPRVFVDQRQHPQSSSVVRPSAHKVVAHT